MKDTTFKNNRLYHLEEKIKTSRLSTVP